MKAVVILILCILSGCSSYKSAYKSDNNSKFSSLTACPTSIDSKYSRDFVLRELASLLNKGIPEFRQENDSLGFNVENGRPTNFFVFDLTEITNKSYPYENCVEFKSDHI